MTEKCDVYSFGVLVLEVVMGTHPRDLLEHLASSRRQNLQLAEVMEKRPLPPTTEEEKDIVNLMKVAFTCLQATPQARPTMQEVYQTLIQNQSSASRHFNAALLDELQDA